MCEWCFALLGTWPGERVGTGGCLTVKFEHDFPGCDLLELEMASTCRQLPCGGVSLDVLGLAFILAYFQPINDKFWVFVFKICLLAVMRSRCTSKYFYRSDRSIFFFEEFMILYL